MAGCGVLEVGLKITVEMSRENIGIFSTLIQNH